MDSKLDSAESEGDTVLLENTDEAGNSGNESDTVLVEKLSSDEIQTISEVAASIQPPEKQQQKQPPEPEPLSSSENANQGNEAKSQRTEESAADIYDVIVIGAGIAGSSAAYLLKKKRASLRVLVLEAKDRVGGRTQSLDLKCSADGQRSRWDVGGQWVTDTQKNITKLLAELGIETYRQFDVGKKILETNRKLAIYNSAIPKISLLGLVDLQLMMMKITSSARKISTLHPFKDSSLARHLDLSNLDQFLGSRSFSASSRSILDPTIRTIFGCEMTQLNTLFGLMYVKSGGGSIENLALTSEGCAQEKRVKGGAQQISERLLAAASVGCEAETGLLLNWALVEVNQSVAAATAEDIGSVVVLTARNTKTGDLRQFKARKVISSMPLNQYVHVGFEPELPAHKRHVFQFCQMGNLIKFIVTYEEAFWRNKGFSGEVVSDGSCLWLNEERAKAMGRETRERLPSIGPIACIFDGTNSEGFPALVGFIGGRCAVEWTDVDADLRRMEVIQALVRFFGIEASHYIDYYEKEWSKEKFSGGCPACNLSASGLMKDYVRAVREPFLNFHFCGTETATVWQGYMDGAAESGERAANEVLYTLFRVSDSQINIDFEKTYFHQKNSVMRMRTMSNQN